jgi:hypothetical protein
MILEISTLRQLIRYEPETGKLFWLERPAGMFVDGAYGGAASSAKTWNKRFAGKEALTTTHNKGHFRGGIFGTNYNAHRVAWALHSGEWPAGQIDHINGNPKDNRIANLRDVSGAENSRNQKLRCTNTSGAMGVHWDAKGKKWRCNIRANGNRIHLGTFTELSEAVAARKSAETAYGFHPNHGRVRQA